jgi:arylsulfatase A-like enzyme
MADRLVDRVLILGWDGLRADHVPPERTPSLCRLIERGVRWVSSTAAFPSETRPNNATIGTGCYPGRHGITANHMLVPAAVSDAKLDTGRPDHLLRLEQLRGRLVAVPTLGATLAEHGMAMAAIGSGSPGQTLLQNADPAGGWVLNPGLVRPDELGFAIPLRLGAVPTRAGGQTMAAIDDYLARAAREYVQAELDPAVMVLWSAEPDVSLHRHGLGSPEVEAAIRANDARLGRILEQVADSGRRTAVLFLSDHGHTSIKGRLDLPAELVRAGLKDSPVSSEAVAVDAGFALAPSAADRLPRLVAWLREQPWCGPVFVRDDRWAELGGLAGALPVSTLWGGAVGPWVPDVQFSCAWDDEPNERGVPGRAYVTSPTGSSVTNHGSLCPRDMRNVLVLAVPGGAEGLRVEAPAGLTDVAPTVLRLLGLDAPAHMQGRLLEEALTGREPSVEREPLLEDRWGILVRRRVGATSYVWVED